MGDYRAVVREIIVAIKTSGLFDRIEGLYFGIVGPDNVQDLLEDGNILYHDKRLECYEFLTLKHLHQYAYEHPESLILYLHTKGCSVDPERMKTGRDWRRYMLHFVVDRYKECLDALETSDVCGVDWRQSPRAHFSGNFWWARADYLTTLPSIDEISRSEAPWVISPRHNAEFWIGMNSQVRPVSLFDCGISVYERYDFRLPRLVYANRCNTLNLIGHIYLTMQLVQRKSRERTLRIWRGMLRRQGKIKKNESNST